MAFEDPAELLTEQFPKEPYNWTTQGATLGPIKALLVTCQSLILSYTSVVLGFLSQTTIQNATGVYLDAHGVLYGVIRFPGESDTSLRTRILAALTRGRNTIPAIEAAVQDYEDGLSIATGGTPVAVLVYDEQSNPGLCAVDAAAGIPVPVFYFVIQLSSFVYIDDTFFLDYTALDDQAYLFGGGTTYWVGTFTDPALVALVKTVRMANTIPIFKTVVTYDTSADPAETPLTT